ncbi:MAG: DUF6496 domain-containing protein, partial [Gemmatimonadaceae bacterium]
MAAKRSSGRKYGRKASEKVERAMHERKRGTLKSGSGRTVTSRKQAIAIGLSEAREEGAKVPARKSSRKKSTGRKSTARKGSSRKKSAAKRLASRKK